MDPSLFGQYVANGLMLGVIYAMVAVGFTLFFGVLDVIKFSHGDVLTAGAFAGLATYGGLQALGFASPAVQLLIILLVAVAAMAWLAALAGIMNGLYYSEINFSIGLLLGVIGFSAAVVGGLGNIYGAILGGFLFAGLQTVGAVLLPALLPEVPSAYKDVFAFAAVIAFMAWRPTGLIAERTAERV